MHTSLPVGCVLKNKSWKARFCFSIFILWFHESIIYSKMNKTDTGACRKPYKQKPFKPRAWLRTLHTIWDLCVLYPFFFDVTIP